MYFIFLFIKKRITPKHSPPWELNKYSTPLSIPLGPKKILPNSPHANIKWTLPYQRYRLMSQEMSKGAAMDEYSLIPTQNSNGSSQIVVLCMCVSSPI